MRLKHSSLPLQVGRLAADLVAEVEGEVRFDAGSRALYARDSSNFRQVPIGVVIPRTLEDVVAVHRICHRHGVPILDRGGGTGLSGGTVNEAVVVDHTKHLTAISAFDPAARTVLCEAGVINERLSAYTSGQGLVFGPDPATRSRCAIGGNIGNNSCGTHSVQAQLYGPGPRTSDNVEELEVVTHDGERFWVGCGEEQRLPEIIAAGGRKGEIYAALLQLRDRYADRIRAGYPSLQQLPRRVSGYNLDELLPERGFNVARALVGTEGTCVSVLRARLRLIPAMAGRAVAVVGFDTLAEAAGHCAEIIEKWRPVGLEGFDRELVRDQRELGRNRAQIAKLPRPRGGAWLLVEFGADEAEQAERSAEEFAAWFTARKGHKPEWIRVLPGGQDSGPAGDLWAVRDAGLSASSFPPGAPDRWPGWEDSAVPPDRLGEYIPALSDLMRRHGLGGAMYGHFGQGCVHCRLSFDLRSLQGVADYRAFLSEAADLVCSFGGSISGEHGDGQQRGELLTKQYGEDLVAAMREFKGIWDPDRLMNPGKVVDARPLDEDLALAAAPRERPDAFFAYPDDGGDFTHATLRCVGVGKCRVPEPKHTMCPSYQVTREEKHSTRGRARLLFEMLNGEVVTDGWQSQEVHEALDLCLACKGCTSDCPVGVDMPTYKAEFLHHYYSSPRRARPRTAYAFGFIDQAARLASLWPAAVNLVTQTPGLSALAKLAAGIDRHRPLPRFAPTTLQAWFRRRGGSKNPRGRRVVLFPDTFTNHLHTEVGIACVEAIEAAGWQVVMPDKHVCCGRPLYDYGFLDQARRYLERTIDVLRDDIRAGTPVVGMEPSCLAVFKDELRRVLPHDQDASRLARQSYHFAEFFQRYDIKPPALRRRALLWGHCHQRATGGLDPDAELLRGMGVEVESLEGGCCGLAGSWGFESGRYGISMECGEQALLPAVRRADPDTLVVADGFSCQTQIEHAGTGRRALHIGEVVRMAHEFGSAGPSGDRPEEHRDSRSQAAAPVRLGRAGLAAAVLIGGAVAARRVRGG